MEQYIQSIVNAVGVNNNDRSRQRIIFLTVGPAGSGKSHMSRELKKFLHDLVIHSLDDYRVAVNNGIYPATPSEHDKINRIVIPLYREKVMEEKANLILLDNTHLKWDPDWKLALTKAKRDKYDLFPILPLITEYFISTNRSNHLGTGPSATSIFLKMSARWFGHRMKMLLNRRISYDVLQKVYPNKPDSLSVNKMYHLQWGTNGFIYVLDNYLGYLDKDMVIKSIKAGNYIRDNGYSDIFLQKDSILHITLIQPRHLQHNVLKKMAEALVKSGPPPTIEYTGVNQLQKAGNEVIYLGIHENSQKDWKIRVDSIAKVITHNNFSVFNKDGLHVTLGYTYKDIWNVDKTVPVRYPITSWDKLSSVFVPQLKSPLMKITSTVEFDSMERKIK